MKKQVTVEDAMSIECKDGSLRSLALNAGSAFEKLEIGGDDPKKEGWNFAKAVKDAFGADFTVEDARNHFKKVYVKSGKTASTQKPAKEGNNTSKTKPEVKEFDKAATKIVEDATLAKNEKIRKLLVGGYKISQIAKALGLSYQRVKNIKKAEDKKKEANA